MVNRRQPITEHEHWHDLVLMVAEAVKELRHIHIAIESCLTTAPNLGAFVSSIHGRRLTMPANIPVPQLLDVEKIVLSVMPRKADGHVDTAAVVTWTASDPSSVGAEPGTVAFDFTDPQNGDEVVNCPGNFNCTATTPNASGTGTVTASAPGYDSAIFGPINYAAGQARSLNASVGSPISDL
jgi:hypothetical protein